MNGAPDVSFIIPAYNVEDYLETAVRSALDQTNAAVEAIIVDDGSTDRTFEIASRLASSDPRVKLIRGPGQGGPSRARNLAIARARGVWIAILDSDDWIAIDRTARLLDIANAAGADIVADNILLVKEAAAATEPQPLFELGKSPYLSIISPETYIRANIMFGSGPNLGYLKPMFRSSFLKTHFVTYDEDLRVGEDFHICLDCLMAGALFVVASEPLYMYRIRASSLSWRLRVEDIDALLRKHRVLSDRPAMQEDLVRARKDYADALARTRAVTIVIGLAKRGEWRSALIQAAGSRNAWRLLLKIFVEKAGGVLADLLRPRHERPA